MHYSALNEFRGLGEGVISSSGSFVYGPWSFSLNIGLNMLHSDSFILCLDKLIRSSTGEFQALELIVVPMFRDMDNQLASCMLLHFLEIWSEMIAGL